MGERRIRVGSTIGTSHLTLNTSRQMRFTRVYFVAYLIFPTLVDSFEFRYISMERYLSVGSDSSV